MIDTRAAGDQRGENIDCLVNVKKKQSNIALVVSSFPKVCWGSILGVHIHGNEE